MKQAFGTILWAILITIGVGVGVIAFRIVKDGIVLIVDNITAIPDHVISMMNDKGIMLEEEEISQDSALAQRKVAEEIGEDSPLPMPMANVGMFAEITDIAHP